MVEALGIERPFGVGHSKGGASLLMAELARPGTFAGLWVFEPIVFPQRPGGEGEANPMAAGARRRREVFPSRADAYDNYAGKPPLQVFHPEALHAYVDHGFADLPDGTVRLKCRGEWEARVFEMGGQHRTFDRLDELALPVTVVGSGDGFGPALIAPQVADHIPGCRFDLRADLNHFGPLVDVDGTAAAIAAAFGTA